MDTMPCQANVGIGAVYRSDPVAGQFVIPIGMLLYDPHDALGSS